MLQRYQRNREFAVIGLGRFGSSLALTLEEHGHTVLGIDSNPTQVQNIADQITQAVTLDATNEEALKAVDIDSFDTVIVAIGNDFESNLLATVALKSMGVRQVICKANQERQRDILLRVGADQVIQPEAEAGRRLADELSTPAILEKVALGSNHSVAEITVPQSLAWKSLAQSDLRNKYGLTVLVTKRDDQLQVSPRADYILHPEDILVVLGSNEHIMRFSKIR